MPNNPTFTRRQIGIGFGSLVLGAGLSGPAFALNNQEASDLISRLVTDLNKIINSGKPEASMLKEFEKFFAVYGDVPIIARSSLGLPWRTASSSQKSRFVAAFRVYMAQKYGRRFREFIGAKIEVTGSKKVKSGFLVASRVKLSGSAPFAVDWQVSDKSGKSKMFNMYIEGISLLATERTEIASMLDKRNGDLDQLIADLPRIQ